MIDRFNSPLPPHTSGHCRRVPVLHDMIAEAACQAETGPFAEFDLSEEEKYELRMAAWLHDCGKISVPEYIMDKSTKLETMQDGIGEIATRIEVVKRDLEISCLKRTLVMPERSKQYRGELMEKLSILDCNRELLMSLNYPDASKFRWRASLVLNQLHDIFLKLSRGQATLAQINPASKVCFP